MHEYSRDNPLKYLQAREQCISKVERNALAMQAPELCQHEYSGENPLKYLQARESSVHVHVHSGEKCTCNAGPREVPA